MARNLSRSMRAWLLALLVTTVMLLQPAGAQAAEGDAEAKAQLESAYAEMKSVKNGALGMDLLVDTPLMDVTGDLSVKFVSEPTFRAEGICHMSIEDAKAPTKKEYSFYAVEDGKDYTVYYKEKGENVWYKSTFSKEKAEKEKKAEESDPAYQELKRELENSNEAVRFGDGNAQQQAYLVTVDGEKLWPAIVKYARGKVQTDAKSAKEVDSVLDAISNIGDVEYEVTVDKATNRVVSSSVDLTRPVTNLIMAMMKDSRVDEMTKMILSMATANTKVTVDVRGSQYNQVSGIKVPKSVVKNAKDEPKDKKEKKDKE